MKKLMLAVLSCLPMMAFCQDLWQGTKQGMSVAEVQALHADAITPQTIDTYGAGSKALLVIPNYKISGTNYKVVFLFQDEKLKTINLTATEGVASVNYDTMATLLKKKYGSPISAEGNSLSTSLFWLNEGTSIRLTNMMGKVIIQYTVDAEADKL